MLLNDKQIVECIRTKSILIEPFDHKYLGANSYDLHLGKTLATYDDHELDVKKDHQVTYFDIPDDGIVIQPGVLYLGVTSEYTETHNHVPFLENKSSLARLGLNIHLAPLGNVNFCNHWTLEISCLQPIRIYKDMPIAQILYFKIDDSSTKYDTNPNSKYNEVSDRPTKSGMWKNFV